ncbi:MAG: RNA polymerase sigma-70 factor [Mangrovibacterium sp.]
MERNNRTDTDQTAVNALRRNSRKAFGQLFSRYSQKLYFFALGYLKSGKDAEEIVQETFIKLWERRDDLNPELSIHAYLFKIAFNFIRKRMIRTVREEELRHHLADELADFDDHTSNTLNYHFLLQHINQLIGQLPPRQKQILELRKLEGYPVKEIAGILGLSIKTVEAHLTASLKFLKERLQSENMDDLLLFVLTFKQDQFRGDLPLTGFKALSGIPG